MEVDISKESFEEWKRQEVTRAVYVAIRFIRQEWQENLIDFNGRSDAEYIGKCKGVLYGLDMVLEMTVED